MECAKFEELGLLYVSGELCADDAREYEAHLGECAYCKREVEQYKEESASLFTADMLGEMPPAAVDAEICRVCANPQKMRQPALMPMMFIKKYAPIPIFLMLVIVAIGGYVRHHSMTAENLRVKYAAPTADTLSDEHASEDDGNGIIDYSDMAMVDSGEVIPDSAVRTKPAGKVGMPVSETTEN